MLTIKDIDTCTVANEIVAIIIISKGTLIKDVSNGMLFFCA